MTPELKDKLYKFLWDESMLYDDEERKLIEKWIDENIINAVDISELRTENTNLLKSLELLESPSNRQENVNALTAALTQAVELIKEWRTKAAASSGKSKEVIEEIWHTYYDHAPQMERIKEALKEK